MIDYSKFFALLQNSSASTYSLIKNKVVPPSTIQQMRSNKYVSTRSIDALCEALGCQPGDLMEHVPNIKDPSRS